MALPHIILTRLNSQESTGYDITKHFSQSRGVYWAAGHQQVYCLHPYRDEISAKILAAQPDDLPHVIQSLENLKDKVEANLEQIQQTNTEWLADKTADGHEIMMKKIVLNRTKSHWVSLRDWCIETIYALRELLIEPQ